MWETGPPSGSRRGPTGPRAHSWGGGPGWGEPSPTPSGGGLVIWVLCVHTVCVSVVSDGVSVIVSVSVNRSVCECTPWGGRCWGPCRQGGSPCEARWGRTPWGMAAHQPS